VPADVVGVLLIAAGTFLCIAFLTRAAGIMGHLADSAGTVVLGRFRYALVLYLAAAGVSLLKQPAGRPTRGLHLGMALLAVATTTVLAARAGTGDPRQLEAAESAGGVVGAAIYYASSRLLGSWGTYVMCALAGILSMSLIAGAGLAELGQATVSSLSRRLRRSRYGRSGRPHGTGSPASLRSDAGADVGSQVEEPPPGGGNGGGNREGPSQTGSSAGLAGLVAAVRAGARQRRKAGSAEGIGGEDPGGGARETSIPLQEEGGKALSVSGAEAGDAGGGEQTKLPLSPARDTAYSLPPLSVLKKSPTLKADSRAIRARGESLVRALSSHGVATRLVGFTVGPTVTRYELELGEGVKVAKVTALSKDIAYAMASPDIRILAPIPGKSAIGIEVPNPVRQLVTLGDLIGPEFVGSTSPLVIPLGKDISGKPVFVSLAEMPHVLIAGATGSGKSSFINSALVSLLVKDPPDLLRLILVDPKRVELGHYSGLPHLLTDVVVDPRRAAAALSWAVKEMERRYQLLASIGARSIDAYNDAVSSQAEQGLSRLPYLLVVIDELNDLMMVAAREVEDAICRIAQMARAVGIHLLIATQRPSVDVITGVIKANIPARIAFSVSSLADSRVILDQAGAERLIGRGDMLFLSPSAATPVRVQAPWVSQEEVVAVVGAWRRQARGGNELDLSRPEEGGSQAEAEDDLLEKAMELVVMNQLGSTSMLQRKLKIGFARAGRLMDLLEQRGVVGPAEGAKPRPVLMSKEEYMARARRPRPSPEA
jgi:S-DNA-T family DNA segregation ATPase FtsK/SpoIIIE